jgi:hypothetical protein
MQQFDLEIDERSKANLLLAAHFRRCWCSFHQQLFVLKVKGLLQAALA